MQPLGSTVDLVAWRVGLARDRLALRVQNRVNHLVMLGFIGAAVGFAIVGRLDRDASDDDEAETRPSPE